jgi:hypothetical protein
MLRTISAVSRTLPLVLALLSGCGGDGDAGARAGGPAVTPRGGMQGSLGASGLGGGDANAKANAASGGAPSGACTLSPAAILATNAVCVCEDFSNVGTLTTESRAAAGGGARTASVGVNGDASGLMGEQGGIDGDFVVGGSLHTLGTVKVAGALAVGRDLGATGTLTIGGDAQVAGNVDLLGHITVGGILRVGGKSSPFSPGDIQAAATQPFSSAPPRDLPCACGAGKQMDVPKTVAAAAAKHDDAKVGLGPHDLSTFGQKDLTLPTGSYFFDRISTLGALRIHVAGQVSLYLDGDLDLVGDQTFAFDDGATLDLYVTGTIGTLGAFTVGTSKNPTDFRLYLGGDHAAISTIGDAVFRGVVYAPSADVSFLEKMTVDGAIFAKRLHYTGDLVVRYAGAGSIAPTGAACRADAPGGAPAPAPPVILR